MSKRIDPNKDELKEAPFLAKRQRQEDGFQVPPGYFRELQDQVIARLQEEEQPRASQPMTLTDRWQRWKRTYRVAASLAATFVLLGLAWFLWRPSGSELPAQLTYDELHEYVQENIDDFELDILLRYSYGEDVPEGLFPASDMEQDEIDRYLDQELDEIELESLEELL